MASKLKLTELLYPTSTTPAITLNSDNTVTFGASTTTITNLSATSITDSGNLNFTGTGNRITGDFSNATVANRLAFQSSTTNGNTEINLIPNGTSVAARIFAYENSADTANSSFAAFGVVNNEYRLTAGITGTATYRPMTFYTGGSERLRLDTAGNLGLGVTPSAWNSGWRAFQIGARSAITSGNGTVTDINYNFYRDASNNDVYIANDFATRYRQISGGHYWSTAASGTAGATVAFGDAKMTLDASGNLGLGVLPSVNDYTGTIQFRWTGHSLTPRATNDFVMTMNSISSGGGVWRYANTARASLYLQSDGQHIWSTAPSGTAGNVISFTQAMTLLANGNLGIGTAVPGYKLDVNGNVSGGAFRFNTGSAGAIGLVTTSSSFYTLSSDGTTYGYGISTNNAGGLDIMANQGGQSIRFWNGTSNAAPNNTVTIDGSGNFFVFNGLGNNPRIYCIGMYNVTGGAAANVVIDSSGGMYRSTSSIKYKKNVVNAVHGLVDLLKLRPVTYESKNDSEAGIVYGGLIAEEVDEAGLTEFVQYATDGTPDALNYGNMVSLCVKAIQEQQAIIESLQTRLTALEGN